MYRFSYVVGHYWDAVAGPIGTYSFFGEVQFGTQSEANEFLDYVKTKSPDREWRIFKLIEYT